MIIPAVTAQEVLDLGLPDNDSGEATIREYLVALLEEVWEAGEEFSGKRPFGNSGWEMDLLIPLAEAGFISGHKDEEWDEWDLDDKSEKAGRKLITNAIKSLAYTERV